MPNDLDASLCMVVLNEKELLPYVLSYYAPYFQDTVIIDNGSTDGTLEYLQEQDIHLEQDGSEDSAYLRNRLQQLAVNDWCFHVDADELIDFDFIKHIDDWLRADGKKRNPRDVAISFPRINYRWVAWPDHQIRLVNKRFVEWQKPVHAVPVLKSSGKPVDALVQTSEGLHSHAKTAVNHPIFHLPRPLKRLEETRARWKRLEDKFAIAAPVDFVNAPKV